MIPAAQTETIPDPVSTASIGQILWSCAVKAFVNSFLVLIFGSIAFDIISGIAGEMTPTPPPGFSHSNSHTEDSVAHPSWALSEQQRFALVFAVLFGVSAWARLSHRCSNSELPNRAAGYKHWAAAFPMDGLV